VRVFRQTAGRKDVLPTHSFAARGLSRASAWGQARGRTWRRNQRRAGASCWRRGSASLLGRKGTESAWGNFNCHRPEFRTATDTSHTGPLELDFSTAQMPRERKYQLIGQRQHAIFAALAHPGPRSLDVRKARSLTRSRTLSSSRKPEPYCRQAISQCFPSARAAPLHRGTTGSRCGRSDAGKLASARPMTFRYRNTSALRA